MSGAGREGDWACGSCKNRNYAFRSLCNRCKQPRLLVGTNTPADSKWLPRIGDWICAGCSNNNYASREICKKCSQSKEVAAMPAIPIPGGTLPTYAHYFARVQDMMGLKMNYGITGNSALPRVQDMMGLKMNYGITGNSALQQSLPLNPNWSLGGPDKYGVQPWSLHGSSSSFPFPSSSNQLDVPIGWRNGDWMCNCGFHNYSSRGQCKQCTAPSSAGAHSSAAKATVPNYPTLGTKRLASEEFVSDWDNKRLNAGDIGGHYVYKTNEHQHPYHGSEQLVGSANDQARGLYSRYSTGNLGMQMMHGNMQSTQPAPMPTLMGKGAKQWRNGDWMCNNCNNHNFATRSFCNRCKTQKKADAEPVSVA